MLPGGEGQQLAFGGLGGVWTPRGSTGGLGEGSGTTRGAVFTPPPKGVGGLGGVKTPQGVN